MTKVTVHTFSLVWSSTFKGNEAKLQAEQVKFPGVHVKFPGEQIHFSGEQVNLIGEQLSFKFNSIQFNNTLFTCIFVHVGPTSIGPIGVFTIKF